MAQGLADRRRGAGSAVGADKSARHGAGGRQRTHLAAGARRTRERSATISATSMRGFTRSTPIPRRPARRKFSPASASRRKTNCGPVPNSPAAGACAWRWRRSCSPRPICCCSTSRPTISISKACLWLEDFLRRYRGTVLIVSHDRDLLNTAAEFILHLEHGKLTLYTGGYDKFAGSARHEARARCRLRQEAGSAAQAYAILRRPLQSQGVESDARRKAA